MVGRGFLLAGDDAQGDYCAQMAGDLYLNAAEPGPALEVGTHGSAVLTC